MLIDRWIVAQTESRNAFFKLPPFLNLDDFFQFPHFAPAPPEKGCRVPLKGAGVWN
jgi:hypothetical protein